MEQTRTRKEKAGELTGRRGFLKNLTALGAAAGGAVLAEAAHAT